MILKKLKHYLLGNLRRQLILGMTLTVTLMVVILVWNITKQQQYAQNTQQIEQVNALADTLSTSSALWVASRDYSGLQETVGAVAHYPNLHHVIVLNPEGMVLAHSNRSKVGLFMSDLPANPKLNGLKNTANLVDITKPIMLANKHIGWVRVGLGREALIAETAKIKHDAIIYALFTIFLSAIIATLASRYLTRRLYAIQQVASSVQSGKSGERVVLTGEDEASVLAKQFNSMLDSLAQRKKALEKSKTEISTLVNAIPDLIWLKDPDGVYLSCNAMFEKMYGAKEYEIVGKTDYDFVDIELADFFRKNDKIAMETNKPSINEEWLTFATDGYHGLFETIKTPMSDANGQLIGVLGVARDITERMQAELELKISATVFESQEGMMVTDANWLIVKVNAAFTTITGYTLDEVKGKNPHLLSSDRHDDLFYASMWKQINETGVWNGEVWNRRKCGEIYPQRLTITEVKNSQNNIVNYVGTMMDISISKAAESEIQSLAFYDPLTKLPNRRLILERINHVLATSSRSGQHGALLFLDLDNFKTLNDTLGHNLGDLLLQRVAERLSHCLRESDSAARLGGDEFVVLLEDLSDQDLEAATQAEATGNKILAALNAPYMLEAHTYSSSASIGITLFGSAPIEADELLKQADIAMYQAKQEGRNTLRFFEEKMQEVINARAELEKSLRIAIEQQQFELYYQIQVDQTGQALGAEALIRWHHPTRGMVSPFEFIPAAEEIGLILPIGQWVLETACAQLQKWQKNVLTESLTISLNVSAKQFSHQGFVNQVKSAVAHFAIDPKLLNLELTESLLLNDIEDTVNTMNALQAIGIRFELDDFGTGYSSLQYLKKLPLYQLKIDRSFVSDITSNGSDQAIVRTIIAMAQSLMLEVIAEGVETKQQRELLLDIGCTRYQGYLFSKPVPINEFEALMSSR